MFPIPPFLIPFADNIKLSVSYDLLKLGAGSLLKHIVPEKNKPSPDTPGDLPHHIPRLCTEQEHPGVDGDSAEVYGFSLLDYCMEHQNVVLLGEAGCGKTQELQWIEICCYKDANLPRAVRIPLRTYSDESMAQLARQHGVEPEEQENLFFLIDGFDEIAGVHKQNFLKQAALYQQENKEARFLISTRNHFYREVLFGEAFQAVWMQPLTEANIERYVTELGISYENWKVQIEAKQLSAVVENPFYLVELCQIYQECGEIPERDRLMQTLTERKLRQDLEKFRMTGKMDFEENIAEAEMLLERLAAAMHAMDTRVLTETEYERLIPSPEKRELLKYRGIWMFRDGSWQFTHNNFGEYLAAKYLAGRPLAEVQELVCLGHPELGISKNWHHVLSYLLPICSGEVWDWLLQQDFTLFLDTDWNRIPASDRSAMLIREWERTRRLHAWIHHQNYRIHDLAEFGMDYTAVKVLLKEIREPQDEISLKNAMLLLGYSPSLYGCQKETLEAFRAVLWSEQESWVYERAMIALLNLELMDVKLLETLLERFGKNTESEVRYPLYVAIRLLEQADAQIGFLLEGLPYIVSLREKRLGNESYELNLALRSVSTAPAARRLLDVLTATQAYNHIYEIDKIVKPAVCCMEQAYSGQKDENWLAMETFYRLSAMHGMHTMEREALQYFEKTGTRQDLFARLLRGSVNRDGRYGTVYLLLPLLDEAISVWILEQYRQRNFSDAEAAYCLDLMNTGNPVYEELRMLYQDRTGNIICVRPYIDYEARRREGEVSYEKAVGDRKHYLKLLEECLNRMNVEDMNPQEVEESDTLFYCLESRNDLQEVIQDYRLYAGKQKSVRQWMNLLAEDDQAWEALQVRIVWQWMQQHKDSEILPVMRTAAEAFYEKHIDSAEFAGCQIWENHTEYRRRDWKYYYLIYFAQRLELPMEKEKARGLLFFGGHFYESEIKELLRRYLTEEELRQEVEHNLLEKNLKGDPLELHLVLCGEYHCMECLETVRQTALDEKVPEYIRRKAIEAFVKLADESAVCRELLPGLDGRLWICAAETVMRAIRNKQVKNKAGEAAWKPLFLDQLWTFGQDSEEFRVTVYGWLIQLQDIRGLRAYRELLESDMEVPGDGSYMGPVESIALVENQDLWPELANLTELCLCPEFKDRDFCGLSTYLPRAWNNVAAEGEEGYRFVCDVLERQQQIYKGDLQREAWINVWLTDAAEAYKTSVQRRWSLEHVLLQFAKEGERDA